MNRIRIRNMKRAGLLTALVGRPAGGYGVRHSKREQSDKWLWERRIRQRLPQWGCVHAAESRSEAGARDDKIGGQQGRCGSEDGGRPAATLATDVPVEVQQLDGTARGERRDGQDQLYDEAGAGDYDPEHVSEPGGYLRRIPATSTGKREHTRPRTRRGRWKARPTGVRICDNWRRRQ